VDGRRAALRAPDGRGDGVHAQAVRPVTRKLFAQYGEAVEDLEVRRANLEDTYMALVEEYEK
jgi:ABC-2 type transport system ATP-binding protein